jgi:uncharacterized protein
MVQVPGEAGSSPEERLNEMLDLIDPEFVIPVADSLPYGGRHLGREGFLTMGRRFAETWTILDHHHPSEFLDIGEGRVLVRNGPVFQSRLTGKSVAFEMVEVLTVRNGKLVSLVPYYFDTVQLLEALRPEEPSETLS